MGETRPPLAMTVHLLANAGHGSLLQQTLDRLLDGICPEVRLFLVSERVSPVRSDENRHPKRSRFPGMSVLLFLHERFGEQRTVHVLNSLQRPPWQFYPIRTAPGRSCSSFLATQEFYSLDSQMPVWGVRQVHRGSEVLRVTLYCSFDNYEDAIGLYEMIVQKAATLQKSTACVFVLYSTPGFALQLCLKQLPLGMSADPRGSSVLQFKVREIGQLVPLLPNPCIPISSTRWQTQDYDGNTILLQVQVNPGHGVRNGELSCLNSTSEAGMLLQGSRLALVSSKRTPEPRNQRSRARSSKVGPLELLEPSANLTADGSNDTSWKSPRWSSPVYIPAKNNQLSLLSPHIESEVKREILSQRNLFQKLEAETNVDTGLTVVNAKHRQSSLSKLPRDLHTRQRLSGSPAAYLAASASKNRRVFEERVLTLSLAGQREPSAWKIISKDLLRQPDQIEAKEGEEEFFI